MHLRTVKRLAEKYLNKCEDVYGHSKHRTTLFRVSTNFIPSKLKKIILKLNIFMIIII